MPLGYHINDDEGLITLTINGEVASTEIRTLARQLLTDAAFDPALPQLIDCRGLRAQPSGNFSEFFTFVQQEYARGVRGTVAVVVDPELDSDFQANAYLVTCALANAEMFENYQQALNWLVQREFRPFVAADGMLAEQDDTPSDHTDDTPE